jgi:hypothetical protein
MISLLPQDTHLVLTASSRALKKLYWYFFFFAFEFSVIDALLFSYNEMDSLSMLSSFGCWELEVEIGVGTGIADSWLTRLVTSGGLPTGSITLIWY